MSSRLSPPSQAIGRSESGTLNPRLVISVGQILVSNAVTIACACVRSAARDLSYHTRTLATVPARLAQVALAAQVGRATALACTRSPAERSSANQPSAAAGRPMNG